MTYFSSFILEKERVEQGMKRVKLERARLSPILLFLLFFKQMK